LDPPKFWAGYATDQSRNQERANREIANPQNFFKDDSVHVLHTKSCLSGLYYFCVNFSIPFFLNQIIVPW